MRTNRWRPLALLLVLFLALADLPVRASGGFYTVNGTVRDKSTGKKLENVNVSVPGTTIGTVSNADGIFSVKIPEAVRVQQLEISHLGYYNAKAGVNPNVENEVTVLLTPYANALPEIVIRGTKAETLVRQAIGKIAVNHSNVPHLMTGFYRETIRKRSNYINITEAIVDVYKTGYQGAVEDDRVQVYKSRQLLSPKADTLLVKLQGGPYASVFLDVVKNRELILDVKDLSDYLFTMGGTVMIDERPHFVIEFRPQVIRPYALFYGKFFIDEATLAFSRAEFSLSMDDRNKATQAILKRKPFNLRFKPEEVSYVATYKLIDGVSYLNYVRSEVYFKCDWKRKLFSTSYSVVSEVVMTRMEKENIRTIPFRMAFNQKHSLSDQVVNFYDEGFWEDYNILEPTESLEAAVNKLKRQRK